MSELNILNEELLIEKKRAELLSKSKNADNYVDTSKGKNRYARRTYSHIPNTVRQYNNISMDDLFKRDELSVTIPVLGETSHYDVKIKFNGVIDEIAYNLRLGKEEEVNFRHVIQALTRVFNRADVYVSCTCDDWKYRMQYWSTQGDYNSGMPQNNPGMGIVNPHDSKGAGCKHVMLVLANVDWMMKVASVITNYINYCKEHMERNYADYIYPKLYGKKYEKPVQLDLFDNDDNLPSDKETISQSNAAAREKGQFKPGNPYQFKKQPKVDQVELDLEDTSK